MGNYDTMGHTEATYSYDDRSEHKLSLESSKGNMRKMFTDSIIKFEGIDYDEDRKRTLTLTASLIAGIQENTPTERGEENNNFGDTFRALIEEKNNKEKKYNVLPFDNSPEQVSRKKRIEWERNKIIDMIIDRYIKEYDIDKETWYSILKNFTEKASWNIKPSEFMLNTDNDVNIMCNEWGKVEDSLYINGVVIKKKVIDKRIKRDYDNPRILLLSNSLGYVREGNEFTDFQSLIKQENHVVDIIKEKITRVSPDIVVVEGDTNKKVVDKLRDENITILTNIDFDTMKRLER